MSETILAFDLETLRLASEVEVEFASELGGASPWARPDLFGFAAGCVVDVDTGEATHYAPGEAFGMLEALRNTETTVSYNGEAFDLNVLSAYGDTGPIREGHIDICTAVREVLEALPEARAPEVGRLHSGGLDGLAKANGLDGKTGSGIDAPALYREGRIEELLGYCEADTRLVADLYRMARERGSLQIEPYYRGRDREPIYLPLTTIPLTL